ncbi:FHA domain-containing protein [Microbacterium betulae]|uniref:FHA domain-containing protein n=1 Tax=Microbacterium betulae TaxID=2981139 RepID=A0AA97FIX1_9MICO|nr:FHA domain-containing protein [Microbacterium sp. AB]WOF23105.1 FHA domain-containing protein [Microbacterium sp. AB]
MSTFSDLTLLLLQYAFLLVLWLFVFSVVFSLRADIFGVRVRKLPASAAPTPPPGGAAPAAAPSPAGGPATAGAVSRIVITSGPKAGLEVPLGREALTIGRSSESGLVIRDDYTSSHHARLVLWGDQWMLQDLESTNGTFLDGERVSPNAPVAVHAGVPVKVGATTFELRK